jgi:hypothetical protein
LGQFFASAKRPFSGKFSTNQRAYVPKGHAKRPKFVQCTATA